MTTITDDPRPELTALAEAIRHANESAKRLRGTEFYERAHEHVNRRLDEYQAAMV